MSNSMYELKKVKFFEYKKFNIADNDIIGMRDVSCIEEIPIDDYNTMEEIYKKKQEQFNSQKIPYFEYDLLKKSFITNRSDGYNYRMATNLTTDEKRRLWNMFYESKDELHFKTYKKIVKAIPDESQVVPVNGKYVYHFRTTSYRNKDGTKILVEEIEVEEGEEYDIVISEPKRNHIVVNYFILSSIQLHAGRLGMINRELSANRFSHVDIIPYKTEKSSYYDDNNLYVNTELNHVYLIDYIETALELHSEYEEVLDEYEEWAARPYRIRAKYLSDIINTLTNYKPFLKSIRDPYKSALKKEKRKEETNWKIWRNNYFDTEKQYICKYEDLVYTLTRILSRDQYKCRQSDYLYVGHDSWIEIGDDKYSESISRLCQSSCGKQYLTITYEDAEERFKTLMKQEKDFQDRRKEFTINGEQITLYDITEKEILEKMGDQFWHVALFYGIRKTGHTAFTIFENFSSIIISRGQIFKTVTEITLRKISLTSIQLTFGNGWAKYTWSTSSAWIAVPEEKIVATGLELFEVHDIDNICSKLGNAKATDAIGKFLEFINLTIASYEFSKIMIEGADEDNVTWEWIRNTGSLISAIMDMAAALNVTKKMGTIFSMISAALDAQVFAMDAISAWQLGYKGVSMGYGICAIGSIITFMGFCMQLNVILSSTAMIGGTTIMVGSAGAAGGAGAFCLSNPAGWVVLIGTVVILAGIVIVYIFTPDEFEIWLKHCMWGKEFGKASDDEKNHQWIEGSFTDWTQTPPDYLDKLQILQSDNMHEIYSLFGNMDMQIRSFLNIITKYDVFSACYKITGGDYENNPRVMIGLNIIPTQIVYQSSIKIKAKIINDYARSGYKEYDLTNGEIEFIVSERSDKVFLMDRNQTHRNQVLDDGGLIDRWGNAVVDFLQSLNEITMYVIAIRWGNDDFMEVLKKHNPEHYKEFSSIPNFKIIKKGHNFGNYVLNKMENASRNILSLPGNNIEIKGEIIHDFFNDGSIVFKKEFRCETDLYLKELMDQSIFYTLPYPNY